ncbi:putative pyrophosphatase/phosphodiesterase [Smittium mucronatum]|uniref:Putative pyrophosphatase/phosphodiesterase n=1 Tax=Smittium mucronatum TaxID=133383 RepID=A0A1R0H739_9FUNG|nr:putative pyrophosphatase/phosphodiesterase [Smittium mucronatum]
MFAIAYTLFFSTIVVGSPLSIRDDSLPLNNRSNTVVLISIDGFAQDYFSRGLTPNIANLGKSGVFADSMMPVFPSVTFPNHYSIATGLYPQEHGIIGNTFYSKRFNATFSYIEPSQEESRWWLGEPFWVTAEKNNLISSVDQFPGSEAEIMGYRPTYHTPYDESIPMLPKMDKLVDFLQLPEAQRPTFLVSYFVELDNAGHDFGPFSKEVNNTLVQIDSAFKYLVDKLVAKNLFDKVNIIIVSDHGMQQSMVPRDYIFINTLLEQANLIISQNNKKFKCSTLKPTKEKILSVHLRPHAGIYPADDKDTMSIYKKLKLVEDTTKFNVYLKKDVPERYVYEYSERIPPILVIANEPYFIQFNATEYNSSGFTKRSTYLEKRQTKENVPYGAHGYDNTLQNMQAIFIAHGSAFRSPKIPTNSTNFPAIRAIDVYNIVTKLLKVPSARNEGNITVANNMLI